MADVSVWVVAIPSVTTLAGALGGYLLAGRNDEARDRRAAEREERAWTAKRAFRLADREHDFQRDVLLEMQDLALRLVRSTTREIRHDQDTLRADGRITLLGADLDAEIYDAGIAFSRSMERVLDDDLRGHLRDLHAFASGKVEARVLQVARLPPDEALRSLDAVLSDLVDRYQRVLELLGNAVRTELGRNSDQPTVVPKLPDTKDIRDA